MAHMHNRRLFGICFLIDFIMEKPKWKVNATRDFLLSVCARAGMVVSEPICKNVLVNASITRAF